MENTPELPPELEPVLAELLVEAKAEPLLAPLPAKKLTAAVREALFAEARPMVETLASIRKAGAAQREALDALTSSPSDDAAAAVGRAGMVLAGAKQGLLAQKERVLERAKWPHSHHVLTRRADAAVGAKHLLGPLRDDKVAAVEKFEKSLDEFCADAGLVLRTHLAELAASRAFARAAVQRFDPPHPNWSRERREDLELVYDAAIFNVMEAVLKRLDEAFRPWGSAWTSNVQLRYVSRGTTVAEAQAAMHERAHRATRNACATYGVEAPGGAQG